MDALAIYSSLFPPDSGYNNNRGYDRGGYGGQSGYGADAAASSGTSGAGYDYSQYYGGYYNQGSGEAAENGKDAAAYGKILEILSGVRSKQMTNVNHHYYPQHNTIKDTNIPTVAIPNIHLPNLLKIQAILTRMQPNQLEKVKVVIRLTLAKAKVKQTIKLLLLRTTLNTMDSNPAKLANPRTINSINNSIINNITLNILVMNQLLLLLTVLLLLPPLSLRVNKRMPLKPMSKPSFL